MMKHYLEGMYYFQPCHKAGQFAFQLSGVSIKFYPLSYTYKECVEDWCERMGYEFFRLTEQYGTYRGSGYFEYYEHPQ